MMDGITLGPLHHIALCVGELCRSMAFYEQLFGFQTVATLGDMTLLSNGTLLLGLRPQPVAGDGRPGERWAGLAHLSFSVNSRSDLEHALMRLERYGVPHGQIEDRGDELRMYVLALDDPDGIRLELIANYT
jgi:catechol-2,3-dioxygenase